MGDAAYKKRKKAEWIAAGRCRQCGREKAPAEQVCPLCLKRNKARVESGEYKAYKQERPRTDGNYIYAYCSE